jgi:hypothetical protein
MYWTLTERNYYNLTDLHTPKITATTAHIKSSQSSLSICLVAAANVGRYPSSCFRNCPWPQSQSYFTTSGLPPFSSSWRQAPWDSRSEISFFNWTLHAEEKMGLSFMKWWVVRQAWLSHLNGSKLDHRQFKLLILSTSGFALSPAWPTSPRYTTRHGPHRKLLPHYCVFSHCWRNNVSTGLLYRRLFTQLIFGNGSICHKTGILRCSPLGTR